MVKWLRDVGEAYGAAASSGKRLLMLFVEDEPASGKLGKVFNRPLVAFETAMYFVPVLLTVADSPGEFRERKVDLTPTVIVADLDGAEVTRWEGHVEEVELLAHLKFSLGLDEFRKARYPKSMELFDTVMYDYPKSSKAPAAAFYYGVAKARQTGSDIWMARAYDYLQIAYPKNVWTMKASAWSEGLADDEMKKAA